jgi:hypothetical protein
MVTRRVPLTGLEGAFEAMSSGEGARTVVVFDGAVT